MSWSIVRQIKAYRLRQTTLSVYLFLKVETGILNKTLFFSYAGLCCCTGLSKKLVPGCEKVLPSLSQPRPAMPGWCLAKLSPILHNSVQYIKILKISIRSNSKELKTN